MKVTWPDMCFRKLTLAATIKTGERWSRQDLVGDIQVENDGTWTITRAVGKKRPHASKGP